MEVKGHLKVPCWAVTELQCCPCSPHTTLFCCTSSEFNFLWVPFFSRQVSLCSSWRQVISPAVGLGIPYPIPRTGPWRWGMWGCHWTKLSAFSFDALKLNPCCSMESCSSEPDPDSFLGAYAVRSPLYQIRLISFSYPSAKQELSVCSVQGTGYSGLQRGMLLSGARQGIPCLSPTDVQIQKELLCFVLFPILCLCWRNIQS